MKLICKMCGCNKVTKQKFIGKVKQNLGKEIDFQICERCHFHYAPDNFYQYVENHNYGYSPRIGTDKKAGREYHLANFAYNLYTQVNDKECPSVLFLGVGESKDHDRIRAEDKFSKSKITDIINYQNSEHHIPLDSPEKFNAIIISEVIEHFVEPREDFDGIFSKLEDDGILVITVNIHDQKSKIEYLSYPFIGGHTCYYTGESLYAMAEARGYSLDFRNLFGSQGYLGPRKKTLIFYKNPNYQKAIGLYFSKNWQVPSEFGNLKGN